MLGLINKRQIKKLKTVAKGGVFLAAVLCFSVCLFSPLFVQGAEVSSTETFVQPPLDLGLAYAEQTGLPTTDIRLIIANIIRVALGLVGIVAVVIIMYGGWLWMTAGGNEDQIGTAKKTLINGVIGLAIILSAYSIVLFVMRMLGVGEGNGGGNSGYTYQQPGVTNMQGGGAWGKVIKDHYPVPNQTEVPRNTSIAITFFKPINFASVASSTSGSTFDLKSNVILITAIIPSSTAPRGYIEEVYNGGSQIYSFPITSTTASGSTTEEIYTIAIKPKVWLGSGADNISYRVKITNSVRSSEGQPIFKSLAAPFYEWYFTCSKLADTFPPEVVEVLPARGTATTKDVIIQITFNEPVFPNAQVSFVPTSSEDRAYFVDNTNRDPIVFMKSDHSPVPQGTFLITNQYRTLQFVSSLPCGVDECGFKKYCLPVCVGTTCKEDGYQVLFRTAPATMDPEKNPEFSADFNLGSGIMDMAWNALDGDKDKKYDRNTSTPFSTNFFNYDNFGWNFTLTTDIDTSSPYIAGLSIGPQTEMVSAYENMTITWSKYMDYNSLYNIEINELPNPKDRCDILSRAPYNIPKGYCSLESLGKAPSSSSRFIPALSTTTFTQILHTKFLDGFPQYYLPEITSAVKDWKGNCYYPGAGPITTGKNVTANQNSCVDSATSVYCCNGISFPNPLGGTFTASCTERMDPSFVNSAPP